MTAIKPAGLDAFLRKPDPAIAAILIYGEEGDAVRELAQRGRLDTGSACLIQIRQLLRIDDQVDAVHDGLGEAGDTVLGGDVRRGSGSADG